MRSFFVLLVVFGVVLNALPLFAGPESDSLYGKGVHAFFDQRYDDAVEILSDTDELNPNDPRPHYFLGLAYLRQKKTEQADQAFKKAAEKEFGGRTERDYAIGETLRRIQGAERQRIEKIRTEERMNAKKKELHRLDMRYGSGIDTETSRPDETETDEDIAELEQNIKNYGSNTFGANPIDPINKTEEIVITNRTPDNPFERTVFSQPASPAIGGVNSAGSSQQSVSALLAGIEESEVQSPEAEGTVRTIQAIWARELGKEFRTFFSRINNQ